MIYAIIILLALAVAFIILVRRLPQAVSAVKTNRTDLPPSVRPTPTHTVSPTTMSSAGKPSFKLPAFNLTPVTRAFGSVASGLKSIKLPSLPKRAPKAAPATMQTNENSTHKEDFWQDRSEKPVAVASPVPVTANEPAPDLTPVKPLEPTPLPPVKAEPISMPAEPAIKTKGRNLPQEAEDAFAIKDYKKAERLYLRLATEDPKNAKVYSRLGVIYLEQKTYEDARDALQAAIKLEPQAASRHFNLALCYIQLGSKAKAISAMEMALKYDPSNRKYRKMLDDLMGGRI